jgi:hypothetical protein
MSFGNALFEYELAEKRKVTEQTFGHLAPRKGTCYPCTMVFAHTCYGKWEVIKSNLPASPWMFEAEQEFIGEVAQDIGVYKFTGIMTNYIFKGKIERIKI